jgi:nucleotide-binding universal stress UspA family protein
MPRRRHSSPRFRSVLCGVDFSRHSRAALRCASALASAGRARLTVLFVDDPLLVAAAARRGRPDGAVQTRAALARFVSASLKTSASRARSATAVGAPGPEITRYARRHKTDMVVVGTRGVGEARALLFGSTTNYVVRHARIPVVVVPLPGRTRR